MIITVIYLSKEYTFNSIEEFRAFTKERLTAITSVYIDGRELSYITIYYIVSGGTL